MCGIIGILGLQPVAPALVDALKLIFYSWRRFAVRKLLILLVWDADFSNL